MEESKEVSNSTERLEDERVLESCRMLHLSLKREPFAVMVTGQKCSILKLKYMKSKDVQNSTSPAIVGNNVLCPVVLDVLHEWHRKQSGWWYGYTKLMIDVRDRMGKEIPLSPIKEALRELRKQGLVKVEPIYKEESGMLNGSGYFYNGA